MEIYLVRRMDCGGHVGLACLFGWLAEDLRDFFSVSSFFLSLPQPLPLMRKNF